MKRAKSKTNETLSDLVVTEQFFKILEVTFKT